MSAPEKIWTDDKTLPGDPARNGYWENRPALAWVEYTRSDLIPAMLAEARTEGYAQGVRAVADACDSVKAVSVCSSGQEYENGFQEGAGRCLDEALALIDAQPSAPPKGRVTVPEGQTPLDDKLRHPLLDAFNEGIAARDSGECSPYHGHSLEHCIHAAGWVQRDLRLALDEATRRKGHAMTNDMRERIADIVWAHSEESHRATADALIAALPELQGWQPIETAPEGTPKKPGAKSYCWMMLAIPDEDGGYHTVSGIRCGDSFFASLTFYRGGAWDTRQLHLKEVQVYPTNWMPLPAPPQEDRTHD